jgi:hypothetical protein
MALLFPFLQRVGAIKCIPVWLLLIGGHLTHSISAPLFIGIIAVPTIAALILTAPQEVFRPRLISDDQATMFRYYYY